MFTIRNFETKTLSWWFTQKEDLDFDPPYQRKGNLWSKKDKSFLIDSILNGFDLPKLYIADFTITQSNLNTSKKPYAIIDGKQRFEAIFDFFESKITLNDDFIYLDDPSMKLAGLSYKDLKIKFPKISSKFENYNLSVVSILTDDFSKINELFVRLNNSKALNGAELRNAMEGVVPDLIRQISSHNFFEKSINFSTQRSQGRNTAAKLLLTEFRGRFVDVQKIQLDRFVKEAVDAESYNFDSAKNNVLQTLDRMRKSFLDKDPLLRSSGLIPVYYKLYSDLGNDNLRSFLVEFHKNRLIAKETEKVNGKTLFVEDYITFSSLSRSLNTQKALSECYKILRRKFKEYGNEEIIRVTL
ncbi:Protein of unknown function DUF262 [Nonlabens sp. Hel1_33_55]|uniref:DUF262 domain-containing protein n=1 Tax=Nonlabens sp. Hel1_33_55 TaxID=1336802 RepID=UPI000875D95F|nr:DUF262 domain-containing protein [Nonlabens sp. Hel1_33_55]SCX96500.1 Protein of unknown function DUF262 [Nonlabens sp. Hel1_33_55]